MILQLASFVHTMLDPLRCENEMLRAQVAQLTAEVERLKRLVGVADRLWQVEDVAKYLNVHVRTVYRLRIRHLKIGGGRRYDPADVQRYLEQELTRVRRSQARQHGGSSRSAPQAARTR